MSREHDIAVYEAKRNAACDEFFKARPQMERTLTEERLFEAGFRSGWDKRIPRCEHKFVFFGDQKKRRCYDCNTIEQADT